MLRNALAHDDDGDDARDQDSGSVDFSIVTNRDDSSASSDLESVLEWEQQNGARGAVANGENGGGQQQKRRNNKWKGQQYSGDGDRDDDLENAIDELMEKRDATKIQALQKVCVLCGCCICAMTEVCVL